MNLNKWAVKNNTLFQREISRTLVRGSICWKTSEKVFVCTKSVPMFLRTETTAFFLKMQEVVTTLKSGRLGINSVLHGQPGSYLF